MIWHWTIVCKQDRQSVIRTLVQADQHHLELEGDHMIKRRAMLLLVGQTRTATFIYSAGNGLEFGNCSFVVGKVSRTISLLGHWNPRFVLGGLRGQEDDSERIELLVASSCHINSLGLRQSWRILSAGAAEKSQGQSRKKVYLPQESKGWVNSVVQFSVAQFWAKSFSVRHHVNMQNWAEAQAEVEAAKLRKCYEDRVTRFITPLPWDTRRLF